MRTLGLTALAAFALSTPVTADETVPEAYQGVWAAARDCIQNFQNVLGTVVNRQSAACRVLQAEGSGPSESRTSAISLKCGGSRRREIWRDETIDGEDYLVIVQLEGETEAGGPSIEIYKRCPGIPLGEIPLSEIPGNPAPEAAIDEDGGPPSRIVPSARHRPTASHPRANPRRRSAQ